MDDFRAGVVLDLDGTLVDSMYHHILSWDEALSSLGHAVPLWRIHAGVGMGGERLVPWLLGQAGAALGERLDALKSAHEERFLSRADGLRATDGALALLDDLDGRGVPYVVASSATGTMADALLAALGRDDLSITTSDDVPTSKPAPDSLLAACEGLEVDPTRATMIGDTPWDVEAALRVGMRTLAVRCGGWPPSVLLDAGAVDVVDSPRALIGRL